MYDDYELMAAVELASKISHEELMHGTGFDRVLVARKWVGRVFDLDPWGWFLFFLGAGIGDAADPGRGQHGDPNRQHWRPFHAQAECHGVLPSIM